MGEGLAARPVKHFRQMMLVAWSGCTGNKANRTDAKYLLEVKENVSMMVWQLGVEGEEGRIEGGTGCIVYGLRYQRRF